MAPTSLINVFHFVLEPSIHIRRSDKSNEAKFYEPEDYMRHVDAFYERYFRDHPHMIATTKRTVYVASDDDQMFSTIKTKY